MPVELKIPNAGESVTEVQIGEWLKSEGDYVDRDEFVVELETDKASMEVPAPVSGRIEKLLYAAGATASVGAVIALIDDQAAKPSDGGNGKRSPRPAAPPPPTTTAAPASAPHVMPAAQRVAAERGVNASQIAGTGPGGRVLKEDVQRAGESGAALTEKPATIRATDPAPAAPSSERHEEIVPMSMLRRRIAERLVQAQQNAAMLTTFNEIDMSAVLRLRDKRNEAFQKRYGIKLGFMSFFIKAAIDALKLIPQVNAEIRGTDVVYKNYYDIGVAVSTERGLVVPVIRNAERLSFAEIEKVIADLAVRGRDGKLKLDELQGGTFTISNGGVFGSLMSTPILNPPQSGILGLHAIQERPVARDGQVVIRSMMYVALTYDHRIVDGRESVTFLKRIKECLEDPTRMLIEV